MSASIEIDTRRIGNGHPCFVIAEVGVNHNGDLRLARDLIDAAVLAGADAVKFQTFTPVLLAAADAPRAEYQMTGDRSTSQREMLAELALTPEDHFALKSRADAAGITFLSSPFDESSVALLESLGVAAIKVPSGEITNTPLLRRIAATGLPIIMSTGMSTFEEIDEAVEALGSARDRLALLHCVSSYPADPADSNLLAMDAMRSRYARPVGWSDHTEGIAVTIAAVALGANVIEKHITLSRDLPGPDHAASIEPEEFRSMVASVRTVELALGKAEKGPAKAELATAAVARKSLHWSRSMAPGESVGRNDLIALRPGTGLPPSRLEEFVGMVVGVETVVGSPIRLADFEPRAGDAD